MIAEARNWADVGLGVAAGFVLAVLLLYAWLYLDDLRRSYRFKRMAHHAEVERAKDRLSNLYIIGSDPLVDEWPEVTNGG